jgi:hypothetical protein
MNILGAWFELEQSLRPLASAAAIPADLKATAERVIKETSLACLLVYLPSPTTPPVLRELILCDDRVYSVLLRSSLWLADTLPTLNPEQLLSLSCAGYIPKWAALAAEKRFQELTKSAALNTPERTTHRKHRKSL